MSQTFDQIQWFYVKTSVAVYCLVWTSCLCVPFNWAMLPLALVTGLTYSAVYVWQMLKIGRLYLDADVYTLPVTTLVFAAGVGLYFAFGWLPEALGPRMVSFRYPLAILGCFYVTTILVAHVGALLYSALMCSFLSWLFRRRIQRERNASNKQINPQP